jgi:hypothetical protein
MGYTTRATNIVQQQNGSYSAQLNFVGSCGSGEHCSWYVRYRRMGTSSWVHVPATAHGPDRGPVAKMSLAQVVTGLTAEAQYEYQVCGNAQPGQPFACVGPDGTVNTTTKFTTGWSLQTNPNGGTLLGVSCTTDSACIAVGDAGLAERWDGRSWTIQHTPNGGNLNAVSCTSPTACIAVGDAGLAERWDDRSWTIQHTPNGGDLSGVSCISSTACTAVGSSNNATLAERWNGSTWAVQVTPNPNGATYGSFLSAVSCTSATACTAVGHYLFDDGGPAPGPLAERWNVTTWTIQPTPGPFGSGEGELAAVSCTSSTACTAAGQYFFGFSVMGSHVCCIPATIVERWDGNAWTITSIPSQSAGGDGDLNGIVCTSATACTAVGFDSNRTGTQLVTLAMRQNGSTWTNQPTPNPSSNDTSLNGVSCTSTGACTAVGDAGLVERRSG